MFNSAILEVATGIVFIYLLLSLMCTALREGIEGFLRTRASYLESGIRELLFDAEGKDLARSFYEHPLIYSLFPGNYTPIAVGRIAGPLTGGKRLPAYIPAASFAAALMDIIARGPGPSAGQAQPDAALARAVTIEDVRKNIGSIANPAVQRAVLAALDTAQGDLEKARKNLEHWYDSAMDRVSGRYKRSTQGVLFWIGLVIAVGFNVDTITLADYLYRNETQRGAIVAQASLASTDPAFLAKNYSDVQDQIRSLQLPIGWDFLFRENAQQKLDRARAEAGAIEKAAQSQRDTTLIDRLTPFWNAYHGWFMKPLGWLLTAFAITLGAPFWFDILNKIMVIRSTVKPHEKSPEEASEDRQAGARAASPPAVIHIVSPGAAMPPVPRDEPPGTDEDR